MIKTKLMKHQDKIVKFMQDKPGVGIFAGFGTGKSLCVLKHIDINNIRVTLIVSTKTSILCSWPDEIVKHSNFKYAILIGSSPQKIRKLNLALSLVRTRYNAYHARDRINLVLLINYDGIRGIYNELCNAGINFLVVDESTRIKSPKTLRTKVLWALATKVEYRAILTGFPVTENLLDIYSQIKFLDNGAALGQSFYRFRHIYFASYGHKYVPSKKSIKTILAKIKDFCIQIDSTVIDLPPITREKINIKPTKQQKAMFYELNNYYRLYLGNVKIKTQYIFTLTNKSLEICDGYIKDSEGNLEKILTNKDEALLELLEDINVKKEKVIIWCAFLFSVNKLYRLLKKVGYSPLRLIGATKNESAVVKRFMLSPKHNILIATQLKAAESITLTNCRIGIYYSNTWSQDKRANSEARIRRKGSEKHKNIIYIDFVTENSAEEAVVESLVKKKKLVDVLKKHFKEL